MQWWYCHIRHLRHHCQSDIVLYEHMSSHRTSCFNEPRMNWPQQRNSRQKLRSKTALEMRQFVSRDKKTVSFRIQARRMCERTKNQINPSIPKYKIIWVMNLKNPVRKSKNAARNKTIHKRYHVIIFPLWGSSFCFGSSSSPDFFKNRALRIYFFIAFF